jgi:hypothetical protein
MDRKWLADFIYGILEEDFDYVAKVYHYYSRYVNRGRIFGREKCLKSVFKKFIVFE